ncbi:hypothetical protein GXM_01678 [Nostoc sphaeroides CCNUC1]|uniref:Uncharacterized protein n=1 Tax=Nostoc sphaeroides CCNUC1 TaxID=2653204 RepID=A0A5P8VUZ0_9NOSO|nr:hypothetical protein GXM_01678 [Nostoc sphaeroides CCNUC1]
MAGSVSNFLVFIQAYGQDTKQWVSLPQVYQASRKLFPPNIF